MKSLKRIYKGIALASLVSSSAAFAQSGSLTAEDNAAIQALATRYFEVLASCDAEGFADLFVDETGYFASGFRGHMEGRQRLIGLVKSERHCDVPPGTPPAARAGDTTRPAVVLEQTATGTSGITDLGTAQYEDEYVKTPHGWRIAARTVIINAEKEAGIDAKELSAIHTLVGPELVDNFVTNERGVRNLLNTGVSLRVADGVVSGRTFVQGGGYNDDVFEKLGEGQWRIKSSTFVAGPATDPLASAPVDEWATNGGFYSNQRWSPLAEINRDNIGQLKAEWRMHLDRSGMETKHSAEATPVYKDGVIYVSTGDNDVFAVDVTSGARLWDYEAKFPEAMGEAVCCGWDNRGLALGDGKVFIGQLDAKLVALDEKTGEVVWETQGQSWEEGYSITGAPLYYDGMVITGYAGAEKGVRGLVEAFDAKTGAKIWTFYTVPGPGEFGHDTWPADNNAWEFGGATVWQTPALDPELGLLYFSTGNPGPDQYGGLRAGDNLFSASMVAIDVHTGEYRWHFQQVHHDLWDYDAPNPVILFDMQYQGTTRKAIAQASKTGWVYILDRITGEPVIGIEEKPVPQMEVQRTAATQPYPIGDSFIPQFIDVAPEGFTLVNQGRIFTPFDETPVVVQPGLAGGANWPPSAYDPSRQTMYVCSSESSVALSMQVTEIPEKHSGKSWTGGAFRGSNRPTKGVVAAIDMTTNKLVWQYRWQDACYSGFLSTAGNLLFVGRNDGRLTALDTDTGKEIWGFQTGAGINAPAISFEKDGRQYIAAYSGGNLFQGSARGDSLWLFSLRGKMEQTTPGDTLAIEAPAQDQIVYADGEPDYVAGENLFKQTCLPCHGEDGMGGHNNALPLNKLTAIQDVMTVVANGRNNMPRFTGALTPEQIRDVSGFVVDRLFP